MGDGPSDIARRAFAKELGDDSSDDSDTKSKMPDAKAVAGKRFKAALDGGDGMAIYAAFKALKEECDESPEEESAEPPMDDTEE